MGYTFYLGVRVRYVFFTWELECVACVFLLGVRVGACFLLGVKVGYVFYFELEWGTFFCLELEWGTVCSLLWRRTPFGATRGMPPLLSRGEEGLEQKSCVTDLETYLSYSIHTCTGRIVLITGTGHIWHKNKQSRLV